VSATHGVILAAGRGSRLGPLTETRPKCLVELAGRTLLEWQLGALTAAGIAEPITLVGGYQADRIQDPRLTTITNPRWQATNMVASLLVAAPRLEAAACLVSYSDIVYHPHLVSSLLRAPDDIAITYDRRWESLWQRRFTDPLSDAETFRVDADGRLREIGRRASSREEIGGQYMGLLKFSPTGWRRTAALLQGIPPSARDMLDMTSLLGRLLEAGVPIRGVPVDGRWCEVDSANDLRIYEELVQSGTAWEHDWRF